MCCVENEMCTWDIENKIKKDLKLKFTCKYRGTNTWTVQDYGTRRIVRIFCSDIGCDLVFISILIGRDPRTSVELKQFSCVLIPTRVEVETNDFFSHSNRSYFLMLFYVWEKKSSLFIHGRLIHNSKTTRTRFYRGRSSFLYTGRLRCLQRNAHLYCFLSN